MSSQHQGDSLLRIVLIVLAVVLLFPLLMMMFAMPMMGWWWGVGPGTGGSPIWGVGMMLLFLVVLLGVGYFLYRGLVGSQFLEHDRALEELRTAYARGDLTDEEFEQRRQHLQRDQE